MTTEEKATKAWHKFTDPSFEEYYEGITDYKAALREAVEKRKQAILGDVDETLPIDDQGRLEAIDDFLKLLESVEPLNKKP